MIRGRISGIPVIQTGSGGLRLRIVSSLARKYVLSAWKSILLGVRLCFPQEQEVVIWHSLAELHEAIAAGQVPVTPRSKKPLIGPDTEPEFWVGRRVGWGRPSFKRFWQDLRSHRAPLSSWIARAYEDELDGAVTLRAGLSGEGDKRCSSYFWL